MDRSQCTTRAISFRKLTRPHHDETDSFGARTFRSLLPERADEVDQSYRSENRRFGFAGTHHGDSEETRKLPDARHLLGAGQPDPGNWRRATLDFRSVQKL